jgi:hypothetical protein
VLVLGPAGPSTNTRAPSSSVPPGGCVSCDACTGIGALPLHPPPPPAKIEDFPLLRALSPLQDHLALATLRSSPPHRPLPPSVSFSFCDTFMTPEPTVVPQQSMRAARGPGAGRCAGRCARGKHPSQVWFRNGRCCIRGLVVLRMGAPDLTFCTRLRSLRCLTARAHPPPRRSRLRP